MKFSAVCHNRAHHSIILSYARDASISWSKQPKLVGLPLRLQGKDRNRDETAVAAAEHELPLSSAHSHIQHT